jgi:uncharacterized protein
MKTHAIRLLPNQDIRLEIEKFVAQNAIKAGFILTCVGSVKRATLRMADETIIKDFENKFEIVSLVGTLSPGGVHLHISLSDEAGNTIGGHMKKGCLIYSTAEIVIGELEDVIFSREFDEETKYNELKVIKV